MLMTITNKLAFMVTLLFSLTVHEWAHARSALALGDDTAQRQGRCTLMPLPHIDLIGTILLPLLGAPFGWAKPVPVNPVRFNRTVTLRAGMMLTSLAGPAANIGLAGTGVLLLVLIVHLLPAVASAVPELRGLLLTMVQLNVVLALFNLLPIPPLDGSRLADFLMPDRLRPYWEAIYNRAPIAFMLLVVVLLSTGIPIFAIPLGMTRRMLAALGVW